MDIYRVTRTDPKGSYRKLPGRPEVRYGTKRRASAIVRQVSEDNAARRRLDERFPHAPHPQVEVLIERAQVGEFTDVTAEFLEDQ